MARTRLDLLLVKRGVYPTRARAAAAVMAGRVRIGGPGQTKPGRLVAEDVAVEVEAGAEYVSRGGIKLANALDATGIDPRGRSCLDVGASTGGFTDCLLKRDAARVTCVDVGYGQLDWGLRQDSRVTVLDRLNARALSPGALPFEPDLLVADVSFISLRKLLPAVLLCAADRFDCLALVKPQFEVGRGQVGKGGVVRSAADRRSTLVAVGEAVVGLGYAPLGFASSGLPGPAGNRETFIWIAEGGRDGAIDPAAAALAVEPG